MAPDILAQLVRSCGSAMLVNPSADGLNLTAKEFVASSVNPESALILSLAVQACGTSCVKTLVTINQCRAEDIVEANH